MSGAGVTTPPGQPTRVAILGGGCGGLAAAWEPVGLAGAAASVSR